MGFSYKQLYEFSPMPNTSSACAVLSLLMNIFLHIHLLNFYYTVVPLLYSSDSFQATFLSGYTISQIVSPSLAPLCYSLCIILTICILVAVLYNEDKFQGFRYILAWIGIRLFPSLRFLIELNTIIPAFFMIIDPVSGIFFIFAVLINLFVTFFLQNYSIPKDYLCCLDVEFLMMYKVLTFLAYGLSAIGTVYYSNIFLIVCLVIQLVIGAVMWFTYFFKGIIIYRQSITRQVLLALIVFYIGLSGGQLADHMCRNLGYYTLQMDLSYGVVFSVLLGAMSFTFFQHIREESIDDECKEVRRKVYFICDKIESFSSNIEDECQMRGLIKYHIDSKCPNIQCFSHCENVFDAKKNKYCSLSKINQNKNVFLKMYVKCLYEKNLLTDSSLTAQIDYTEFSYYQMRNTYRAMHLVEECDSRFQFPFDRIRLNRLKKAIVNENRRLNKQLYDGNLDIQFVIECEKRFESLKSQLIQVLKKNLLFWEYVHRNKIDLTELIEIVRPNFSIMEDINQHWKELAKYFEIQKKWKFYYAWYSLYVKNEKLKPVILEYFGTEVHEDDLFSTDSQVIDKSNEKSELKNSRIIFEPNTAVIHTNNFADKPDIKKVNNYFSKLFGYTDSEVLGTPITCLMPKSVAEIHPRLFSKWCVSGRSNTEPNFVIKKIYAKHKQGYLFCVYKYLKQFVTEENELEYVAMLKACKDDESMCLLDCNYIVEGMTNSLFSRLGLDKLMASQDYRLSPFSFFLICPRFIKDSIFSDFVTADDEVLFGLEKQNKYKTRAEFSSAQKNTIDPSTVTLDIDPVHDDAKTTMRQGTEPKLTEETAHHKLVVRIPDNLAQVIALYETEAMNCYDMTSRYEAFKRAYALVRDCQNASRYNCEVDVVSKNYDGNKYYEIFFREIYSVDYKQEINVVVEKKKKKDLTFQPEDFHKFFESSQDNRAYSLAFANNIFIKEDNNKPVEKLSHIDGLTFFMRLFFLSFIAIILVAFLLNAYVNFETFRENGHKLLKVESLALNMHYLQNKLYDYAFYNQGNLDSSLQNANYQTSLESITRKTFKSIQELKNHPFLKKAVFDDTVNLVSIYPSNNPDNPGVFDEIDIVFRSIESTGMIFSQPLTIYGLSYSEAVYLQQYMFPSYNRMTVTCMSQLNNKFDESSGNILKSTIIIYVIEGLAIGLGFVLAMNNTQKITSSFISIMEVFTQFSQADIVKIYKYCHFLAKIFKHLNEKDAEQKYSAQALARRSLEQEKLAASNLSFTGNFYDAQNNNININKKIKKVEIGSILNKLRIKSFIFLLVFLLLFAGSSFYLNTYIKTNGDSISSLATQGLKAFKYLSTLTKVQLAVKKKFADSTQYYQQFAQYLKPDIDNLVEIRNINSRMSLSQNFKFLGLYNNIYFEDVCNIYAGILQSDADVAQCRNISRNSLQHGIQSFVYYYSSVVLEYLDTPSTTISSLTMYDLEMGLYYCNIFLQYLADQWFEEFSSIVSNAQQNLLVYAMCILSGYLVVYLVLVEILIIGNLGNEYDFFKRVYEMYMPDFLVSKEKIIKAKLIVDGILNK